MNKSGFIFLTSNPKLRLIVALVLMVCIGGISYMVLAYGLGFYNDDWYLIYVATSQGVGKFFDVFAIDRPFRGYFVSWIYSLFGVNAWLYSLSAFIMRCIAALAWFWILRQVWPHQRQAAFLAALLSLVYPGFLDQPNAFDFQSHQWSFALAVLSIAFSVAAFQVRQLWVRGLMIILSMVTQLIAYLLMEYYIGLEGLRLLLVAYMVWQAKEDDHSSQPLKPNLTHGLSIWLPALAVAFGFLYWQTQVLQIERDATNVNLIFEGIASSPALRLAWMGINLLEDLLDVVVFAWTEPVYHLGFSLRLRLILLELVLAAAAGVLGWIGLRAMQTPNEDTDHHDPLNPTWAMIIIGLMSASVALVPVHMGGRQVIFDSFSRFSLTPSLGAVLSIAGVWLVLSKHFRVTWLAVALVCLAVLAHTSNTLIHAEYSTIVRNFWWQVSWRIPQIEEGTVLLADYAGRGIAEDYFVWGPANLIYYPEADLANPDRIKLSSVTLNPKDLAKIISLVPETWTRRSIIAEKDFSKLLVLSMSTEHSCVTALDNTHLELSEQSHPGIVAAAPYSQISQIILADQSQIPPEAILGPEPAHGWCYYFEKASLARQQSDWEEIVRLGDEVIRQDLRPYDWIEWMPFIQAYAYVGDEETVEVLALILRANPVYRAQACRLANTDPWNMAAQYPVGQEALVNILCAPDP